MVFDGFLRSCDGDNFPLCESGGRYGCWCEHFITDIKIFLVTSNHINHNFRCGDYPVKVSVNLKDAFTVMLRDLLLPAKYGLHHYNIKWGIIDHVQQYYHFLFVRFYKIISNMINIVLYIPVNKKTTRVKFESLDIIRVAATFFRVCSQFYLSI